MKKRMAYIGTKACGCVVACVVDVPKERDAVAQSVQGFIQRGYTVRRVSLETARKRLKRCPHIVIEIKG